MTRKRLLLVQTGTPPAAIREEHGDLPRWFRTLLAPWQAQLTAVRVFEDEPLPAPDRQTVAVLTGSWAMVSDRLAWSERTADWIRQAVAIGMPLFGVCYGHQLMAHALVARWRIIQPDGKAAAKPFRYRRGVSTTRCSGTCRPPFPRI